MIHSGWWLLRKFGLDGGWVFREHTSLLSFFCFLVTLWNNCFNSLYSSCIIFPHIPKWNLSTIIPNGYQRWFLILWYLQLAGLLAISSRFLPTVMNLLRRLAEEAQGNPTPQPPRPPPHLAYQSSRHHTQQSNPAFSLFPDSSVSSNISSSDGGIEHSSPNLKQRRSTKVEEVEVSGWETSFSGLVIFSKFMFTSNLYAYHGLNLCYISYK